MASRLGNRKSAQTSAMVGRVERRAVSSLSAVNLRGLMSGNSSNQQTRGSSPYLISIDNSFPRFFSDAPVLAGRGSASPLSIMVSSMDLLEAAEEDDDGG